MRTEPGPLERRVVDRLVGSLFLRDRRGGPWPPPDGASPVRIPTRGGARLAGLWMPAARPRGAVVLAHPDRRYGKHWFVREGWTAFLLEHGYDVLAFDFPGYGETPGTPTWLHEHLVEAARFAEREAGGFPVHVVGVSLGAFAAANAAPRLDFVHALVLESPYPTINAWYGRGPRRRMMDLFDRAFPRSAATIQAERNLARAGAKRILVGIAAQDEVTPPALSEAVARAGPAERTRAVTVEGARHLELFRDGAYRRELLRALAG